ncbi:hypothetical protein J1N35_038243, partial [Gossypium stocksii]
MGQEITISVETLSSYLSITNKGDKHYTNSYATSLTKLNDYVGYDINIHDQENWVCKFDGKSSTTQASTVPLVAPQSSDAPRSSHEAYPALLTLSSPINSKLYK